MYLKRTMCTVTTSVQKEVYTMFLIGSLPALLSFSFIHALTCTKGTNPLIRNSAQSQMI